MRWCIDDGHSSSSLLFFFLLLLLLFRARAPLPLGSLPHVVSCRLPTAIFLNSKVEQQQQLAHGRHLVVLFTRTFPNKTQKHSSFPVAPVSWSSAESTYCSHLLFIIIFSNSNNIIPKLNVAQLYSSSSSSWRDTTRRNLFYYFSSSSSI